MNFKIRAYCINMNYEDYNCVHIQDKKYKCPQGHVQEDLEFLINTKSILCTTCDTSSKRFIQIRDEAKKKSAILLSLYNRKIIYICKCGNVCKSWDNNILKKNFIGCKTCGNPFNNPSIQEKISKKLFEERGVINRFQLPEVKEKIKITNKALYGVENVMQNSVICKRNFSASVHKKILYTFPSGKTTIVQGYEHLVLDILLHEHNKNEDDIITGNENMPPIWYYIKDKKHRYFPDIFLDKENIMIEVKSDYTMNKEKNINIEKFKATVKCGYELHLYVFKRITKNVVCLDYTSHWSNEGVIQGYHPLANVVLEE